MFSSEIGKDYPKDLYDKQFSFYVDNIVARIDMQKEAWSKEEHLPGIVLEIYDRQKADLLKLKEQHGSIVHPDKLS